MRISVEKGDRGYKTYKNLQGRGVKVFLNGKEQKNVVTADEEIGYVKAYVSPHEILDSDELVAMEYRGEVIICA